MREHLASVALEERGRLQQQDREQEEGQGARAAKDMEDEGRAQQHRPPRR
jgi:hypothetical protein